MTETLNIGGLEFEIRRSSRRKKLGLTVDRSGELVVHAPEDADKEELARWVHSKLLWVHQKLALKQEMTRAAYQPEFVSGETIFYLGRNYRLKIVDDQDSPLRFDGHWFFLRRKNVAEAPKHFQRWYSETGSRWLHKRVASWEHRAGTVPGQVTLGDLGYRWGSCGKKGALHFNWRLLQLPVRLVDYVIVHELVHLQERNHTPEYWRTMDRILPDWRDRKSELETGWQSYMAFGVENDCKKK
ncbi:MAG TPA: M48 family metallopeptidase [Deltaproteobacteria bacterium]|nr:M48 family metallopeptidase [Deltaproteobacteria bacterium]